MGLDMYMTGRKHLWRDYKNPENDRKEDGRRVSAVELDLGYWRKHPDLHGFIVRTFASGVDECQEIELDAAALRRTIDAVKEERLPHTEGFFFGASDPKAVVTEDGRTEKEEDVRILEAALAWLEGAAPPPRLFVDEGQQLKPLHEMNEGLAAVGMVARQVNLSDALPRETRSVVYRASW